MRIALFTLALFLLVSCQHATTSTVKPALVSPHWVQGSTLEKLMKRIASQTGGMQGGVSDDVESSNSQADSFESLAALALELSQTARSIPESANLRLLSETDERAFMSESYTLSDQAMELHRAASEHQVEPMQRSMLAINSTCISCHSRFRELAGDLDQSVTNK